MNQLVYLASKQMMQTQPDLLAERLAMLAEECKIEAIFQPMPTQIVMNNIVDIEIELRKLYDNPNLDLFKVHSIDVTPLGFTTIRYEYQENEEIVQWAKSYENLDEFLKIFGKYVSVIRK